MTIWIIETSSFAIEQKMNMFGNMMLQISLLHYGLFLFCFCKNIFIFRTTAGARVHLLKHLYKAVKNRPDVQILYMVISMKFYFNKKYF